MQFDKLREPVAGRVIVQLPDPQMLLRRARRCGKCKACDGRARDILQRERFAEIAEMAGRVAGYESPLRTARSVCALAERVAVWRDVDALAGLVELCAFVLR